MLSASWWGKNKKWSVRGAPPTARPAGGPQRRAAGRQDGFRPVLWKLLERAFVNS